MALVGDLHVGPDHVAFLFMSAGVGDIALVDDLGLSVVVINRRPRFSAPIDDDLLGALQERLNWTLDVGRFTVLWRGPD